MDKATKPEELSRLIGDAITAGDLEGALSLYETDATFAIPAAFGEGSVTGHDALREAFRGFLGMNPVLTCTPEKTLPAGDSALVIGDWTLTGRDPDGNEIETGGRFADVARRQPDGTWLFALDNPNGTN